MKKKTLTLGLLAASAYAFGGTLTWNGGAAGTWDATTPNWLDAAGNAVAWKAGETAVIPAGALVNVMDTLRAEGVTLGANAVVAGPGELHLTGAVDVSSGTASFAVSVWSLGDLAKTGAGTLAMNALAGPVRIDAGVLATGGLHANRALVTENGGTHAWWAGDPAAADLVTNGSFEEGPTTVTDYTYVKGDAMPYGWASDSSYFVLLTSKGMGTWANTGDGGTDQIPDGSLVAGIQLDACVSQTLTVPADGFYELSYTSFRRTNAKGTNGNHLLDIQFDDVTRAVVRTVWKAGNWCRVGTGPIWLTAGTHVLKFAGEGRWSDSVSFVDQVELRACANAAAPTPDAVEDFLSDGNLTLPSPEVTSDASGNHYVTQLGTGASAFASPVDFQGRFYLTTAGQLSFLDRLRGTGDDDPWIFRAGPGTVRITGGMETFSYYVEEGRTEVKLTSPLSPIFHTHVGRPAAFYYDLNGGSVTITGRTYVQGSGPATLGTLGTGAQGVHSEFYGCTVPEFTLDIGAGDTFQCKNVYQQTIGNAKTVYQTALVKAGPGTLRLTENTSAGTYPLNGPITLRDGTFEFTIWDIPLNGVHPWLGSTLTMQPALGVLGNALTLGDAQTPTEAALVLRAAADGVVSTRALNVRAAGQTATLAGAAGETGFLGTITLGRATTEAVAEEGGVLHLGTLAKAADYDGVPALVCAQGAVTVDAADGEVALVSTTALQATRTGGGTVSLAELRLGGALSVAFDGAGHPGVFATRRLVLENRSTCLSSTASRAASSRVSAPTCSRPTKRWNSPRDRPWRMSCVSRTPRASRRSTTPSRRPTASSRSPSRPVPTIRSSPGCPSPAACGLRRRTGTIPPRRTDPPTRRFSAVRHSPPPK